MCEWTRHGQEPVIDNGKGISGAPHVIRMDNLWVMVYFGAGWKPRAFDSFACSRDFAFWTKWDGPFPIEPSADRDQTFAHKPSVPRHDGVAVHFYCGVAGKRRTIALATLLDLRKSD